MLSIVIADGLVNDVTGQDRQWASGHHHVGIFETERLIGRGRGAGTGPLVRLLRSFAEEHGGEHLILLKPGSAGLEREARDQTGSAFIEPISDLADAATVIGASVPLVPASDLAAAVAKLGGWDAAELHRHSDDIRVLVAGCHTEQRVLAVASHLRNAVGLEQVAVCSHLVASATRDAHYAALRHQLPQLGIQVLLSLEETAEFVGVKLASDELAEFGPCEIIPADFAEQLSPKQRRIIQLLCVHWTQADLRPLAGGFSGSLLLLADGWKEDARTEPMVLKIDAIEQMRREIEGYQQVKDFFGKNVPTFGYPVSAGNSLGIAMELAAMEGRPETLQAHFEEADNETALSSFLARFDKALGLLGERLYGNTTRLQGVAPFRAFGLHTAKQLEWLLANGELINAYHAESDDPEGQVDIDQLAGIVRLIARNEDVVESEACLEHGDLNFANVICDEGDNVWFIDWTHSGRLPLELDFAKLENDAKFVMSKEFDREDLPRLRVFEEMLLTHRVPPEPDELPGTLKFVKWDLRFRKVLETVRRVRKACFGLKQTDSWLLYRVGLLRYAMHTLSFDARRDRGECDATQLMYALYSVEHLAFELMADDFHLKIRAERPDSYPPRHRIPIDEAPWILDSDEYDPPYFVSAEVLEADRTRNADGWADPEDFSRLETSPQLAEARFHDPEGRPLNPRGRTGIAGRGALGFWGPNRSVASVVVRQTSDSGWQLVLGQTSEDAALDLPKGFVLREEEIDDCSRRVLLADVGWAPEQTAGDVVFEGYTYDARQTDHAWVVTDVLLFDLKEERASSALAPGERYGEVGWYPLDADTVNGLPPGQAEFARAAIKYLGESGRMERKLTDELMARTG
jgi:ADP-ribose pyrophosphatase